MNLSSINFRQAALTNLKKGDRIIAQNTILDRNVEEVDSLPELEREIDSTYQSIKDLLHGRRIVNIGHILFEYEKIIRHSERCTMGRMAFVKETRFGLISRLHFFCDNCDESMILCTDPSNKDNDLSSAVVWGNLSIGIGKNQCKELFAVMDIPFMTQKTFIRKTCQIKKIWERKMLENMLQASEEEKKIAIEKGNINADGTPFITVIVDGGWCKRSYGFNAASEVVSASLLL
ncbi:uncharacterized protein LOC123317835 [Coccinella septempunctata]|uniref:uncharacterized protein LOC123317835 n=1 Tax=Coccinella septempunctata TaxID=41139 RepID=UPI001D069BE3|nr:uncharacterized protein LOC123317835 [Coccinella septempunctata]